MNESSAADLALKNNFFAKKNLTTCKSKKRLFFIAQ